MKFLVFPFKNKKIISNILLLLSISHCSSPNQLNNNLLPAVQTFIDHDAYVIQNTDASVSINDVQLPRTDGRNGERIAPLNVYQQAPFGGVLLNAEALVFLESSFREQAARCEINRRFSLGSLTAMALRDITVLETALDTQRREANILISSRDRENQILRENNSRNWTNYLLYGGIGAAVGISIFSILYFFTR
jgi:hypothetical protein